jgi:GNAT superfamily N-acetyltransferase
MSDVLVRDSPIAGLGVFAARPFAAGETVLVLDDSRVVDSEHPLDESAGELSTHRDFLAHGVVVLMPSPERYINSSCDPNTYVVTRPDGRHVIALSSIQRGEEITYDYLINCHGGEVWPCHCGAATCRGTIPASFFDLSPAEQWRLWTRLDRWFVQEHQTPLRPPRPDDVPALVTLSEELGYPVSPDALTERLTSLLARPDQMVLVAADDEGNAVGWIHGAEQLLLEVGQRCEILGLVVSRRARRQGLGRRLVAGVEDWARQRGLPEVSVRSNIVREEAHPFYERLGYVRVKTQHAYRKALSKMGAEART